MPSPPNNLIDLSNTLVEMIKERIVSRQGWIGFDEYMEMALYEPGLGYYSAGMQKFGEEGDFITAPMMGQWFAGAIARQCEEIFNQFPENQERVIMEFGGGNGDLAAALIPYLNASNQLARYVFIETSADLQQRQHQRIKDLALEKSVDVSWLDALPAKGISGIVIANELLDALPVKRFVIDESGCATELGVAVVEDELKLEAGGALNQTLDKDTLQYLNEYQLKPGYHSEIGLQARAWMKTIGEKLTSGAMILADYGFNGREYYHPDRKEGTLMCHYRHQAHGDAFLYPGLQDITAHIDFTGLVEAGENAGLQLAGYGNQGGFLLSLGVLDQMQEQQSLMDSDPKRWMEIAAQIKKLTLPHEMGELFKVMVWTTKPIKALTGFRLQNHRGRL